MSMRIRTKICGITRVEDALAAAHWGADAIGLVFYPDSPRHVSIKQAEAIVNSIPPFVSVVALFVNADSALINEVLSTMRIDILQFHGDETESECLQYKLPYMKAIRVKEGTNLLQYETKYSSACALLLDAYSEKLFGGTGETFNWSLIPNDRSMPIVLAGGLSEHNVLQAIRQVKPYAIDVSGGVELSKGIKDVKKIAALMHQVSIASTN